MGTLDLLTLEQYETSLTSLEKDYSPPAIPLYLSDTAASDDPKSQMDHYTKVLVNAVTKINEIIESTGYLSKWIQLVFRADEIEVQLEDSPVSKVAQKKNNNGKKNNKKSNKKNNKRR